MRPSLAAPRATTVCCDLPTHFSANFSPSSRPSAPASFFPSCSPRCLTKVFSISLTKVEESEPCVVFPKPACNCSVDASIRLPRSRANALASAFFSAWSASPFEVSLPIVPSGPFSPALAAASAAIFSVPLRLLSSPPTR